MHNANNLIALSSKICKFAQSKTRMRFRGRTAGRTVGTALTLPSYSSTHPLLFPTLTRIPTIRLPFSDFSFPFPPLHFHSLTPHSHSHWLTPANSHSLSFPPIHPLTHSDSPTSTPIPTLRLPLSHSHFPFPPLHSHSLTATFPLSLTHSHSSLALFATIVSFFPFSNSLISKFLPLHFQVSLLNYEMNILNK